jgi:mycofactocin precursor
MSPTTLSRPAADALGDVSAQNGASTVEAVELVLEELLVEEISIDGMCGVY